MKTITTTLLLLTSISASASSPISFNVKSIGCFKNGTCFIDIDPASSTNCNNNTQIRLDITQPGTNAQYSAALTAFSSNKEIRVEFDSNCLGSFPQPLWLNVNNSKLAQ